MISKAQMAQFSNTVFFFFALMPSKRMAFINNKYFKGDTIKIDMWVKFVVAGCKENHFYSLPFEQAEASIY